MNYNKVLWGFILILIGSLFILKNLDIISFSWFQFINLWPLLIVLWGIALLPVKSIIKLLLSVAVIFLGIFLVQKYQSDSWADFWHPWKYKYERKEPRREWRSEKDKDAEWHSDTEDNQYLFFTYSPDITNAVLKLDAAAGSFYLDKVSEQLIEVEKEGNIGNYSLTSHEDREKHIVKLSLEENTVIREKLKHRVDIKLHPDPVWDLDMNIGAARLDFDLSSFKTNKIDIDGGASSITLKVGNLYPEVNIDIDAGVSSVVIEIPESSGCQVKASSVLSDKELKGFKKTSDDRYETENFSSSSNKIVIRSDVAISKIEVKRY